MKVGKYDDQKKYNNTNMEEFIVSSPVLACGRSWLENCLMELGLFWDIGQPYSGEVTRYWDCWLMIKKIYINLKSMNSPAHFNYMYPCLMKENGNVFDKNLAMKAIHDFPSTHYKNIKSCYVIRDFKYTIYAQYKREQYNVSFNDYMNFREFTSLLPLPEFLSVHAYLWSIQPNSITIKHEDYKKNDVETLKKSL